MATRVNELEVWDADVPVVTIGSSEFDVWNNDVPVVDQDESTPNTTTNRRRPTIY
jgi:hypothetical protein